MGDSRPEGERNFWNGREAVTAKGGPYGAKKPKNELVTFIHVFKKKEKNFKLIKYRPTVTQ